MVRVTAFMTFVKPTFLFAPLKNHPAKDSFLLPTVQCVTKFFKASEI